MLRSLLSTFPSSCSRLFSPLTSAFVVEKERARGGGCHVNAHQIQSLQPLTSHPHNGGTERCVRFSPARLPFTRKDDPGAGHHPCVCCVSICGCDAVGTCWATALPEGRTQRQSFSEESCIIIALDARYALPWLLLNRHQCTWCGCRWCCRRR